MINNVPSAESGKINVAPNALLLSQERYFEVLRAVDAVMVATKNLRVASIPKDVIGLSAVEQSKQPSVNTQFEQMTSSLDNQYVDNQFNSIVAEQIKEAPQVTAPTDYISLKGDEHPNQAAIDEAMLRAMEAYDNNDTQDLRV